MDAIPDELREDTKGAGNTEENSVVLVLLETVVLKQDTRVGINIRPGVLGLSVLLEDDGGSLVNEGDEVEERVGRHVLESILTLASVTRIGLTENGMTIARYDLTGLKSIPESLGNLVLGGGGGTKLLLQSSEPTENLLVGKSVKRTGKTVHTSGQGKVRIRESRADQVSGVGRDVASLVVRVNGQIETEHLIEAS
jgi:hypothetical protein